MVRDGGLEWRSKLVLGTQEHGLSFRREDVTTLPAGPGLADPHLLGSLLLWMAAGVPVHVHGPVSRRLLVGLHEWQGAWARWRPDRYRRVPITADEVVDGAGGPPASAVVAFSGGVDSAFTVHRRLTRRPGPRQPGSEPSDGLELDLRAGMLVHGFDVPLDQPEVFERARHRTARILEDTGVALHVVRTDLRRLGQDWEDGHGLALAACLSLFAPEHGVGLIGSGSPWHHLDVPWGSSPATDHLLSGALEIRHDGADTTRLEKIRALSRWDPARAHLRTCWHAEGMDRNCGRCGGCVRTMVSFAAVAGEVPAAYDRAPRLREIVAVRSHSVAGRAGWRELRDLPDSRLTARQRLGVRVVVAHQRLRRPLDPLELRLRAAVRSRRLARAAAADRRSARR